jgi:hypothetical protein
MNDDYSQFLLGKATRAHAVGIEPGPMHDVLFDYQRDVTAFCLRQGRAALFLDTGLGKSACILEWCDQAAKASNGYALILTPLAVAKQFEREARKFGYVARVVRTRDDVRPGINVCNYDRLDMLDCTAFGAVALDESSILKSFTGKTTRALIEAFARTPYRLCATATPAPNDHMELGNHAEFLGIMNSQEMLARWFINDASTASQQWRLKKAAVNDFWDWVASWARCAETPADLGYDGSRFVLPELKIIRHQAMGDVRAPAGSLFIEDLSATNMHDIKRQTAGTRAGKIKELIDAQPDEPWLVFTDTDYEAAAVKAVLPGILEVKGTMKAELKEAGIEKFIEGKVSLLSKPSVVGAGLNFQHCARIAYVGRSFSYEAFYQSVRRCWRFGQTRPVEVHIVVAEGEDQIGRVIDRKADGHKTMKTAMAAAMKRNTSISTTAKIKYNPSHVGRLPEWLKSAA